MLGVYGFAGEIPFGFVFFSIFDLPYQQKKTHLYYSHRALQSRFHLEIISGETKIIVGSGTLNRFCIVALAKILEFWWVVLRPCAFGESRLSACRGGFLPCMNLYYA